jgi:two-component system response regulator YesN
MEKAKELLRTTGYTVNEIAEQVGYNSSQYFAVCFKKYTGISPGVYRDQI